MQVVIISSDYNTYNMEQSSQLSATPSFSALHRCAQHYVSPLDILSFCSASWNSPTSDRINKILLSSSLRGIWARAQSAGRKFLGPQFPGSHHSLLFTDKIDVFLLLPFFWMKRREKNQKSCFVWCMKHITLIRNIMIHFYKLWHLQCWKKS
jgi:hypothetical protein